MRDINDKFINDLLDGELSFFLEEVKDEQNQYSLEIRDNYIDIYYRGGRIWSAPIFYTKIKVS